MVVSNIRLTKLRRLHFVDVDDNDVGSLEDITFAIDNLEPQHLILGSNFFEELMEEIGKRENIDEIAPLSIVSEIDSNHAILSESIDDLERTTGSGDYLRKYQVILYSMFQKYEVHDNNGVFDGELIDVQLNGSESQFIFNYPSLKSKLMTDGYMQRFEIAVPLNKIEISSEKLIITTNEEDIALKAKEQHQPKEKGKSTIEI
ncbi:MAG: hypothetical protein GPJ54_03330 [Candidatus Heimdallarchaeota archaeon]|nr:hypothetical protein [Candidatus Heimdallarchaeota archaeon]